MPQYRYRALAQGGEIVVGEVEAPSDDEVLRRIEYLGHLPIDTEVVKPSVRGRSSGIGRRLPKSRDVTIFLRQLALLIGAGLPLEAALQTLGADTNKALSAFAGAIRAAISAGDSFAEALSRCSPSSLYMSCRSSSRCSRTWAASSTQGQRSFFLHHRGCAAISIWCWVR